MAGKRKRQRPHKSDRTPHKRCKTGEDAAASVGVTHPTLSLYYPQTLTLRDYVLSKLPATSKTRKRKISALGKRVRNGKPHTSDETQDDAGADLVKLLDRTLVCRRHGQSTAVANTRGQDFRVFSQRNEGVDESSLLEGGTPQSEVGLPTVYIQCSTFILHLGWAFNQCSHYSLSPHKAERYSDRRFRNLVTFSPHPSEFPQTTAHALPWIPKDQRTAGRR